MLLAIADADTPLPVMLSLKAVTVRLCSLIEHGLRRFGLIFSPLTILI